MKFNKKAKLKSNHKKVNRNKSKKIIAGVALVATLGVAVVGCNIIKQNPKTNVPSDNDIVYATEYEPDTLIDDIYEFKYEYDTPSDKEAFENSYTNIDIYRKYEETYGIDANLLCAIGAQESSGIHHSESINGFATGIMGIEYIWSNADIQVFNFNTNSYETITVDDFSKEDSKIGELDYNIMIGTAIFQNYFYDTFKNVTSMDIDESEVLAFTIQKYNMGPGHMRDILKAGNDWIGNRDIINAGDSKYFEHVLSRLDNDTIIKIKLPDGSYYTTRVVNTAVLDKIMVRA